MQGLKVGAILNYLTKQYAPAATLASRAADLARASLLQGGQGQGQGEEATKQLRLAVSQLSLIAGERMGPMHSSGPEWVNGARSSQVREWGPLIVLVQSGFMGRR